MNHLHPVIPVMLLRIAPQALQQLEKVGGLQEGLVHGDVGLAVVGERVVEALVQLPACAQPVSLKVKSSVETSPRVHPWTRVLAAGSECCMAGVKVTQQSYPPTHRPLRTSLLDIACISE